MLMPAPRSSIQPLEIDHVVLILKLVWGNNYICLICLLHIQSLQRLNLGYGFVSLLIIHETLVLHPNVNNWRASVLFYKAWSWAKQPTKPLVRVCPPFFFHATGLVDFRMDSFAQKAVLVPGIDHNANPRRHRRGH